ncbi:CrcB family protein [Glaciihabitans arcticus]|uniref:Fluoride-specific ion channel FluC n=1 Tax=Glaciihabitans arcticus TaxID=2668039 RepID=A0A4Q9GSM6_9MICO|nr:CrcB family protein [Glaciihabitans arcticus]TBN58012.1 CrcB family protein [Glaciihabitans arcticus]
MRQLAAVIVGALVGTALRLGVDVLVGTPLSTLLINIAGSFALALLVARLWPTATPVLRAALGPGLLGTFTTFSAVAVALVSLSAAGEWMPALAYLAATLIGGLAAAFLGLRLGRRR